MDRYAYLKLDGVVGDSTFGFDRYINQSFYTSSVWRQLRSKIIVRDEGCDLAIPDRPVGGTIFMRCLKMMTRFYMMKTISSVFLEIRIVQFTMEMSLYLFQTFLQDNQVIQDCGKR